ncbi:MAG: AMP-binding protein [Oligoflexus sp.]
MKGTLKTPLEMLYQWEAQQPKEVYLRQPIDGQWHEYSWQRVADEVRIMAKALQDMGHQPGTRIGIISKNCAHWIMADLAIMMAGCISVPLYPSQQAETTRYILEHSDTKLVFVGKLDDWQEVAAGIPSHVKKIALPYPDGMPSDYEWDELIHGGQRLEASPTPALDQLATIIYTSGTTGFPKGVMHSFRSMAFVATNMTNALKLQSNERFFSYLPLAHVAERSLIATACLYLGAQMSFVESMDTFVKNLQEVAPTVFFSVPRLWAKFQEGVLGKLPQKKLDRLLAVPVLSTLIKKKIQKGLGLHQAKAIGSGAAPISPVLLAWYQKIGITIMEGYGQTENFAYGTINRGADMVLGSVGQAWPNCDIKIDDNGEVLIKNDAVMIGYYNDPEKTAEVLTKDGYIRTGDLGKMDKKGRLQLTGRVKELFKTEKGKYIAPAPIESKLWDNTLIEQLVVTGHGLPQPVSLLVLSESARLKSREEIDLAVTKALEKVNQGLNSYEKIKHCIVVKDPWTIEGGMLTPTLKVKRHVVEERYQVLLESTRAHPTAVIWE